MSPVGVAGPTGLEEKSSFLPLEVSSLRLGRAEGSKRSPGALSSLFSTGADGATSRRVAP
jgi:hypothetical protein